MKFVKGDPFYYGGFLTLTALLTVALTFTLRLNSMYETLDSLGVKTEDLAVNQTSIRDGWK